MSAKLGTKSTATRQYNRTSYRLLRVSSWGGGGGALASLFELLPVGQDMSDAGRIRQLVHFLEVFLRDFEGPRRHVGNVLADQFAGVDGGLVDFLEQERSEGLHPGAKEGTVEGDVDSFQRDRSLTTLKVDRVRFGFGDLHTLMDDAHEMSFEIFQRHRLHQRRDINVLGLQVIEKISQAIKGAELLSVRSLRINQLGIVGTYIASSNVLHVCNIVVDDFQ